MSALPRAETYPAGYRRFAIPGVVLAFALLALWVFKAVMSSPADSNFDKWVFTSVVIVSALLCLIRGGLIEQERFAWLMMALGLAFWAAGEVYFDHFLPTANPPFPSPADAGYLAFYVPICLALWSLARSRIPTLSSSLWLDGLIGALTVATLTAAVVVEPLVRTTHGRPIVVAASLAYPLSDLVLLGVLAAVFGMAGWRIGTSYLLVFIGLVGFWLSDLHFLLTNADGTYVPGTAFDAGWPLAAALLALAAWQRPRRFEARHQPPANRWQLLAPMFCATGIVSLLLWGNSHHINGLAQGLAAVALVCVLIRVWQVYAGAQDVAGQMTETSLTDALTPLGNRRRLMAELEALVARIESGSSERATLVMFDLNGFKTYNDTYGHCAGDELLRRLAVKFKWTVELRGSAFRLGGDEFCALLPADADTASSVNRDLMVALTESGPGYVVDAACGSATIPDEARSVSEAMRCADRRMYAGKAGGRDSVSTQMRDVLGRALLERGANVGEHDEHVAMFATATARQLGLTDEQVDEVGRCAELHDVGKVAVPDNILRKPDQLTEAEWNTIKLHTIVGERILAASPALAPVGRLVRATHEKWDGTGYPDGLVGERIPIGARIVAVCDAFNAMVSDRPYRKARSDEWAVAELERCSGTQFDPRVVEAFIQMMSDRQVASDTLAA